MLCNPWAALLVPSEDWQYVLRGDLLLCFQQGVWRVGVTLLVLMHERSWDGSYGCRRTRLIAMSPGERFVKAFRCGGACWFWRGWGLYM